MARYTTSGTKTTVASLNAELEKVEQSIAELLSRTGENPNQMEATLDMNSNPIINLPEPKTLTEPLRLGDLSVDGTATLISTVTEDSLLQAVLTTVPAEVGEVLEVKGYSSVGDGGASYWTKTASTDTASETPVQRNALSFTDASGAVFEIIESTLNPLALGADPTGVSDSTIPLNLYIRFYLDQAGIEDPFQTVYGDVSMVIPEGIYSVSSLNFTNTRASRNYHIQAFGAVFVGNTTDVAVVDCIGSRWLWFWGLTVIGTDANPPLTGCILGEIQAEACGNNKFYGCQFLGNFTKACFMNMGSETTQYYSCRFSNINDQVGSYSYYADGQNLLGYSSLYITVTRPINDPVSFTNNYFYSCQFRNLDVQPCVYLTRTAGWTFDRGCYFLTFGGHNIELYVAASSRHRAISFGGLFETRQNTPPSGSPSGGGVQNVVKFVGDGTNSTIEDFVLDMNGLHAEQYIFTTDGNITNLELRGVDIKVGQRNEPSVRMFDPQLSGVLEIIGRINAPEAEVLNMDQCLSFNGEIYTKDKTLFTPPTAGAYSVVFLDTNERWDTNVTKSSAGSIWQDINVSGGSAFIESKLNTISLADSNLTLSTIVEAAGNTFLDTEEIFIRTVGSNTLTVVNGLNTIRTGTGSNLTLTGSTCMHLIRIQDGSWQVVNF